jgi:hypothetical protein
LCRGAAFLVSTIADPSMEPRTLRVGPDGLLHSSLRDQFAANPLHNLSYAQNVGYALPGLNPTPALSESMGQDSILKAWQFLSPNGVSSLNVTGATGVAAAASSAMHSGGTSAFPGVNFRSSAAAASASTAAAAAAAAAATAAANRTQRHSLSAVAVGGTMQSSLALSGVQASTLTNVSHVTQHHQQHHHHQQQQQQPVARDHSTADVSSSRTHISRAAVLGPPSSKPWADFIPGGEVGAAAAAAASAQLQNTLAASLQSNSRRIPAPSSAAAVSGRASTEPDRVSFNAACCHRK